MDWFILAIAIVILAAIVSGLKELAKDRLKTSSADYKYSRKDYIMTSYEAGFFKRLEKLVGGKYYVFPQIHLSALALNQTKGKYFKAGFQRINRRSVDYVLTDKDVLKPMYAVELDDRTHDTEKGQAIDKIKTEVLSEIGLPLVRFRSVDSLTDEDIKRAFQDANETREQLHDK